MNKQTTKYKLHLLNSWHSVSGSWARFFWHAHFFDANFFSGGVYNYYILSYNFIFEKDQFRRESPAAPQLEAARPCCCIDGSTPRGRSQPWVFDLARLFAAIFEPQQFFREWWRGPQKTHPQNPNFLEVVSCWQESESPRLKSLVSTKRLQEEHLPSHPPPPYVGSIFGDIVTSMLAFDH